MLNFVFIYKNSVILAMEFKHKNNTLWQQKKTFLTRQRK